MAKFYRVPTEIEAVYYDGSNRAEVISTLDVYSHATKGNAIVIRGYQSEIHLTPGNYLVKLGHGNYVVYSAYNFQMDFVKSDGIVFIDKGDMIGAVFLTEDCDASYIEKFNRNKK